jgi:hypothetical protein
MRTYSASGTFKGQQHARIFSNNDIREPCTNAKLERSMKERQIEYFKKSLIDSEDILQFGQLLADEGYYQKARKLFLKAAELNHPDATEALNDLRIKENLDKLRRNIVSNISHFFIDNHDITTFFVFAGPIAVLVLAKNPILMTAAVIALLAAVKLFQ